MSVSKFHKNREKVVQWSQITLSTPWSNLSPGWTGTGTGVIGLESAPSSPAITIIRSTLERSEANGQFGCSLLRLSSVGEQGVHSVRRKSSKDAGNWPSDRSVCRKTTEIGRSIERWGSKKEVMWDEWPQWTYITNRLGHKRVVNYLKNTVFSTMNSLSDTNTDPLPVLLICAKGPGHHTSFQGCGSSTSQFCKVFTDNEISE